MAIKVTREVLEGLLRAAKGKGPEEACGLLLGEAGRITEFVPTRNVHPTPQTHFEIDPQALIDAHRGARAGGLELIGYFHSHPSGDCTPSATDQEQSAGDGRVWIIAGSNQLGVWRDDRDGFCALSYTIVEG